MTTNKMHRRRYYLIVVLMILQNLSLQAQWEPCGTITEGTSNYAELKDDSIVKTRDDYIMPLQLHIVTDNNGHYEANVDGILNEILVSNSYFDSVNITLELCGINYIENSDIYDFDKAQGYESISSYNVLNAINIYVVETLVNQSGNIICGTAFYPWSFYEVVILNSSCATNGSTMAHEIGHYLGLYHTHNTSFGEEFVDRSNCEDTGDLLCDTPADPKLSSSIVNSSCLYTGTETDIFGYLYQPTTELIMSYSRKSCRNIFTEEQGVVMRNVCDLYYSNYQCDGLSSISNLEDITISVFPNPTSNILNIEMSEQMNFQASLYNLQGILLQTSINEHQVKVDVLPEGIYLLEIMDSVLGHTITKRVMISR